MQKTIYVFKTIFVIPKCAIKSYAIFFYYYQGSSVFTQLHYPMIGSKMTTAANVSIVVAV